VLFSNCLPILVRILSDTCYPIIWAYARHCYPEIRALTFQGYIVLPLNPNRQWLPKSVAIGTSLPSHVRWLYYRVPVTYPSWGHSNLQPVVSGCQSDTSPLA
jgi:hypothetical protein